MRINMMSGHSILLYHPPTIRKILPKPTTPFMTIAYPLHLLPLCRHQAARIRYGTRYNKLHFANSKGQQKCGFSHFGVFVHPFHRPSYARLQVITLLRVSKVFFCVILYLPPVMESSAGRSLWCWISVFGLKSLQKVSADLRLFLVGVSPTLPDWD